MDKGRKADSNLSRFEQFAQDIEKISSKKMASFYVIEKEENKTEMGVDSVWKKVSRFFKREKATVYDKKAFAQYVLSRKETLFGIKQISNLSQGELVKKQQQLKIFARFMKAVGNSDLAKEITTAVKGAMIDCEGEISDGLKKDLHRHKQVMEIDNLQKTIDSIKIFDKKRCIAASFEQISRYQDAFRGFMETLNRKEEMETKIAAAKNAIIENEEKFSDELKKSLQDGGKQVTVSDLKATIDAIKMFNQTVEKKGKNEKLSVEFKTDFHSTIKNLNKNSSELLKRVYLNKENLTVLCSHNKSYSPLFLAGAFINKSVISVEKLLNTFEEAETIIDQIKTTLPKKEFAEGFDEISLFLALGSAPNKVSDFLLIINNLKDYKEKKSHINLEEIQKQLNLEQQEINNIEIEPVVKFIQKSINCTLIGQSSDLNDLLRKQLAKHSAEIDVINLQTVLEAIQRMDLLLSLGIENTPLNQLTKSSIEETQRKLSPSSIHFLKQTYLSNDYLLKSKNMDFASFVSGIFLNIPNLSLESVKDLKKNFEMAQSFMQAIDNELVVKLRPEEKIRLFRALGSGVVPLDKLASAFDELRKDVRQHVSSQAYNNPSWIPPQNIKTLDAFCKLLSSCDPSDPDLNVAAMVTIPNGFLLQNAQFLYTDLWNLPSGIKYQIKGEGEERKRVDLDIGGQSRQDGLLAEARWVESTDDANKWNYVLSLCLESEENKKNIAEYQGNIEKNPKIQRASIPFDFSMVGKNPGQRASALALLKRSVLVGTTPLMKSMKSKEQLWETVCQDPVLNSFYKGLQLSAEEQKAFQEEVYRFTAAVLRETQRLIWNLKGENVVFIPFQINI